MVNFPNEWENGLVGSLVHVIYYFSQITAEGFTPSVSESRDWLVVEFVEEDGATGILPRKWLNGEDRCYWPRTSTAHASTMVKRLDEPQKDWNNLKVAVIGGMRGFGKFFGNDKTLVNPYNIT